MTGRGVDAGIAALAARQHAVFSLHQLEALGLSARAVQHRVDAGRLVRIHRGVYSLVAAELLTREGRWLAAVLAAGMGAVLSHRSAAALHGLLAHGGALIDVCLPGESRARHHGVRPHRSGCLHAQDVTVVNGIPATTVARTLVDLAATLRRRPVERACDQAEILELFDLAAIQDQFQRHPRRPGTKRLKAILDSHDVGRTPTWSELEERFLALVRRAGLPEPEVNAWIDPGDGEPAIRVDFVWRRERVALETDGHATHRTRHAFEHDRRRDQRLIAAHWRPLRATWRQITRTPHELRVTLRRVFHSGPAAARCSRPPDPGGGASRG